MSGGSHGGSGAMKDLMWVILLIVILFAIWFLTGGPARLKESGNKPFLNPLEPVSTGETYDSVIPKDGFVDPTGQ